MLLYEVKTHRIALTIARVKQCALASSAGSSSVNWIDPFLPPLSPLHLQIGKNISDPSLLTM